MALTQILSLIDADLRQVNENIIRSLESQVDAIQQIGHYLIDSGGKSSFSARYRGKKLFNCNTI